MSNREKIASVANSALTAPGFEKAPGFCKRFVRQVIEAATGGKVKLPTGLDARQTFAWCRDQGWVLPAGEMGQPGDVWFKVEPSAGAHGHVGIRIEGNRIAENSSCHSHNGSDARGTRNIPDFGGPVRVVRIPG